METIITHLADFASRTGFDDLPPEAVEESKRLLLDSIGCALGAVTSENGKISVAFSRRIGGNPEATIIGYGDKLSCFSAVFANGELIHAYDYDSVLMQAPGHVAAYVIPSAMAVAEMDKASGKDLILANALAHEISIRIGSGLAFFLDIVDGRAVHPAVFGMSACVFGGAAAVGKIRKLDGSMLANAMGISGLIAPVQSVGKWIRTVPPPTIKFISAGQMCQTALTATFLAELGHTGDLSVLEGDYGFWRFTGSAKWDPEPVTRELGKSWRFPGIVRFKPYPAVGEVHPAMDSFLHVIQEQNLQPEEIEKVRVFSQMLAAGSQPVLRNEVIATQSDSQMSVSYAFSLLAHRIKPGPAWHDLDTLRNPKILGFMKKVSLARPEEYPEHFKPGAQAGFPRGGRIEITAKGQVFVHETEHPVGDPTPASARSSNNDLAEKFKHNASRILPWHKIDRAVDSILNLEKVSDVSRLMEGLRL